MKDFLNTIAFGNTFSDYLLALATFLMAWAVIKIIQVTVISRLKRWSHRTVIDLDDRLIKIIERPLLILLYAGAFYVSVSNLALHPILQQSVDVTGITASTVLVIRLLGSLVEYGLRLYALRCRNDPALVQTIDALTPAAKGIVWSVGLIFFLDNLGFDISAVVTSLGIGGVAVALAAQGILAELFSYISILFDRPFEIGDFIIAEDLVGTVERIGLKTTRLRSITGEELIVSNTDITGARIKNFKRMARRRIAFTLSLTYKTTALKMREIPDMIQGIIDQTKDVTFERAHFSAYGESSLDYEVVYFVESNDYDIYMNVQQAIYLAIKEAFDQAEIEFAYPTRTLHVANISGNEMGKEAMEKSMNNRVNHEKITGHRQATASLTN